MAPAELIETENDMEAVVYLLPVLGCAAMMGVMMWMMRGTGNADGGASEDRRREISQLRAEIERLGAERGSGETDSTRG